MLHELSPNEPLCPDCKMSSMLFTGRWWECSCGAIQFPHAAAGPETEPLAGPLSAEPC